MNATELREKIDGYFAQCDKGGDVQLARKNGPVTVKRAMPYTLPGLAVALGFTGTQAMLGGMTSDPECADLLIYARSRIEDQRLSLGLLGDFDSKLVTLDLVNTHNYVTKKEEVRTTTTIEYTDTELDRRLAAMTAKVEALEYNSRSAPLIECSPQPKLL